MSQTSEFNQAIFEFKYKFRQHRRRITVIAIVLLVLLGVNSVFYSVDTEQQGVVLRFGRHAETTQPGLHAKFPWPIEQVTNVPTQEVRGLEFGFGTLRSGQKSQYRSPTAEDKRVAEMLTGDLNLGHVEWIVQYRIADPYKFLFKLGGSRNQFKAVEDTIQNASETVMRLLVGDVSVDEVLTFGRDRIAGDAKRLLQEAVDGFDCGVTIVTVKLQSVSPPESVKDAFDSVNRARQNKERIVNEARGERNRLIPEARGKRDRAIAEAEGYREKVVRTTQGRANAFLAQLAEYEKAPEITRTRLYLEAMQDLLATVKQKIVIDESVRSVLPLLNLNEATSAPIGPKGGK
ncbi:MAG TPA: FtsH protease activity modulator HflK [Phycisphaerae bacterium]|nr:FtsH protease activity modulator HflK [Phycisphaerae bacterium]